MTLARPIAHPPATRPSEYPVEVLWSLEDCKTDPDVKLSATNVSRPPMEQAIRHGDGRMITASEWAAIKASARMVKVDLLSLPPPRDRHAKDHVKTKTFFRTYYYKEWEAALFKMESMQPLLALCAAHWKADHVLGNTLLVKSAKDSSDSDEPGNTSEHADKSPRSPDKKKRPARRNSREKKRQKRAETSRPLTKTKETDGSLLGGDNGTFLTYCITATLTFYLRIRSAYEAYSTDWQDAAVLVILASERGYRAFCHYRYKLYSGRSFM
jgi:hypothetical protein